METLPHIKFEMIRTEEQFKRLEAFAESFGHSIATRRHPITLMKRGDKVFGYSATSFDPLAMFGWHTDPRVCTPRDVCDGVKAWAAWARLQYGGGFTIAPMENTNFTPEIMNKLGLGDTKCRLYELLT